MPRPLVLIALLLPPATLVAAGSGESVDLSLAQAQELALARNHDVRIERETVAIAQAEAEGAAGSYDTALHVEARYRDRTDPVNSVLSGAPPGEEAPEQRGMVGMGSISQQLSSGGTLSASASMGRDETDSVFALLTPSWSTSVGVSFRQPLLRNRSVDPTRTRIRVARLEHQRSLSSLRATLTEIVAGVEQAYWSLVAAERDLAAREENERLALEQLAETATRVEAGDLAESDLAEPRAAAEQRKVERLVAWEEALRGANALKARILDSAADPWWTARLVPSDEPEAERIPVALEEALAQARASRPEIAAAAHAVERDEVERLSAEDVSRPELDLVASYALRGLAGEDNPDAFVFPGGSVEPLDSMSGELGRSFGTLADGVFPDASIGLALDVPIGNRAARADLAGAEAARRRSALVLARQTQAVEVEVRNAVIVLEAAAERIDAARAGREAAETQLRVEQERFAVGLGTNFLVLSRQNDLTRARVDETAALTDYRKARAEYDRSRGRLLEERGIAIEEDAP